MDVADDIDSLVFGNVRVDVRFLRFLRFPEDFAQVLEHGLIIRVCGGAVSLRTIYCVDWTPIAWVTSYPPYVAHGGPMVSLFRVGSTWWT